MATPLSTSTSPQWDNRNRGFISPAELQQLRQASPGRAGEIHDLSARQAHQHTPSSDITQSRDIIPTDQPQPTQQQRLSMPPPSHARTSSFFSFRNRPQQQEPHPEPSNPPSATHNRRPSNLNGGQTTDFGAAAPPMGQSKSIGPTRSPPDQQPEQQPPSAIRRNSLAGGQSAPPPLHPEIRSVVQLTLAHARKVYFSGPLVKRLERQPDGQKPSKDDGWVEVWAQLGGTTLSIWDMREVEEANRQGREVPPAYFNTTDAFVQVLGSITVPAPEGQPPKKYSNVLTLNTAGSNLLLFSCPSTPALISWAAALRLSAWEKSRLEEIYTAHLLRITLPDSKDTRSTLQRGRMEGWVRIRVAGQTDWKRMWMVVFAGAQADVASPSFGESPYNMNTARKKRMSSLFSREQSEDLPPRPMLSLYVSPKPKDKKKALLTLTNVTQAFAVYPERPELISRSTLMKLEGLLGEEETAGGMRGREGWLLVMPELEAGNTQAAEMLKWVVAIHDAFELYGRPKSYTWDPRDPVSMLFAYPVGPNRDLLFLDRELAETTDPRDERTSTIRSRLLNVLFDRMRGANPQSPADGPPTLPPVLLGAPPQQHPHTPPPAGQTEGQPPQLPQLPSLGFEGQSSQTQLLSRSMDPNLGRILTPITELNSARETSTDLPRPQDSLVSGDQSHGPRFNASESDENAPLASYIAVAASVLNESKEADSMPVKPTPSSPPPTSGSSRKLSWDSLGKGTGSRPDSKLSPSAENVSMKPSESSPNVEIMGVRLPFSPLASPESPSFSSSSSMSMHSPNPSIQVSAVHSPPSLHSTGKSTRSTPCSPTFSVLTSPYSMLEKDLPSIQGLQSSPPLSSPPPPRSLMRSGSNAVPPVPDKPTSLPSQSQPTSPPPKPVPEPSQDSQNILSDALFYMQQLDEKPPPPRRIPTTISERSDSSSMSDHGSQASRPTQASSGVHSPSPARRALGEPSLSGSLAALGRKPSGARALTGSGASRILNPDASSVSSPEPQQLHRVPDSDTDTMSDHAQPQASSTSKKLVHADDVNVDALAALSFLDANPAATPAPPQQPALDTSTRDAVQSPSPRPQLSPQPPETLSAPGSSENGAQYKSTFAPSKQAVERKARLQAQQAANQAAAHRPGRANGKRGSSARVSGWNESSDEEEEEEEEEEDDDDDADSDAEPSTSSKRPSQASGQRSSPAPPPNATPIRPLRPQSRNASPAELATATDANPYAQLRNPRNLPPVPRPQTQGTPGASDDYFEAMPPQRRFTSDPMRNPEEGIPPRHLSDLPQQTAQRHNVWTQVLDPSRQIGRSQTPDMPMQPSRDTFIQLEPASVSMTKAFTPHGLLSAGMQDKSDRSAKRQEELARETGASLINVPHKPPPPQTGLLGAITALERERKRDGGFGAALTEREREKRVVEDRQRKLDELQRQQLEMAQSGMFGSQFPMGMNPMMANPMMMGMNPMMTGTGPMMPPTNPMMTGGFMGYPGMMPGYGGQPYMLAAQQAAQAAYQQAMMAFSAGHVGDGMHGPSPMAPMMTGAGMGFDPRMSMMGMPPMMTGMPMGGMGNMGMMGGMPGMGGMGPQMTGGSAFDARFSPSNLEDLRPPGPLGGPSRPGNNSSRNSSAGQGSPAGPRPVDAPDRARDSPKN